jgi:hypothetical protein
MYARWQWKVNSVGGIKFEENVFVHIESIKCSHYLDQAYTANTHG